MEIIYEIDRLIQEIDRFAPIVASGDRDAVQRGLEQIFNVMTDVIPQVTLLYETEKLAPYKEDQAYWGDQLARIAGAVEAGDLILLYDALIYEMKANLLELKKIV